MRARTCSTATCSASWSTSIRSPSSRRATWSAARSSGSCCVADATTCGSTPAIWAKSRLRARFPTIWKACARGRLRPRRAIFVPVAPAAHYLSEVCGSTSMDERRFPGSSPLERWPQAGFTAPIASRRTRCSRVSCSLGGSPACCPSRAPRRHTSRGGRRGGHTRCVARASARRASAASRRLQRLPGDGSLGRGSRRGDVAISNAWRPSTAASATQADIETGEPDHDRPSLIATAASRPERVPGVPLPHRLPRSATTRMARPRDDVSR